MVTRSPEACPPEVLEWIAWYPDQGLSDEQRGRVEAHAAGCSACREEIACVLGRAEPQTEAPDPTRVLARLLSRIDGKGADGAAPTPAHENAGVAPAPRLSRRRPALALAAAVTLALAVTTGVLAGRWLDERGTTVLETAGGRASAGTAPTGPELDVVFSSDATASRISEALRTIGAEIVGGPTALNRYRVALPRGADAAVAARMLRSEGADVALFAEPVAR